MCAMLRLVCLLFIFGGAASPVQAFGAHGHQTVGGIADQLLRGSPTARHVRNILGSNLQTAAVWADCVKGVGQARLGAPFVYDGTGPYPECDYYENPASQRAMEAFVRRNALRCYGNSSDEVCRHKSYHYTDVATTQPRYARGLVGTSEHDLVAAIQACVAVLREQTAPAPFNIASKKEALRLLAHYLGDLHQPMHVVSVYLDATGRAVDPDVGVFDPKTSTKGANTLLLKGSRLHALWDGVPGSLVTRLLAGEGAMAAAQVPATAGGLESWPESWATETLAAGQPALSVLSFAPRDATGVWRASAPADYKARREALQREQMIKAGARLAALLQAIWP